MITWYLHKREIKASVQSVVSDLVSIRDWIINGLKQLDTIAFLLNPKEPHTMFKSTILIDVEEKEIWDDHLFSAVLASTITIESIQQIMDENSDNDESNGHVLNAVAIIKKHQMMKLMLMRWVI